MPWKPSVEGEVPTLGYYAIDWVAEVLAAPSKPAYEPFRLYREQEDFLLRWYQLDPTTGRFVYDRGLIQRPRGWGKSPLLAAVAALEGLADVVFDGWDADGQPVGRPWSSIRTPLVHIAAVSEDQPLALDTPVWTPNGWSTVGNLTIGDEVFASNGEATPISRATPVFLNEDCYEVEFDDGEAIVASGNHQWTVQRLNGHLDAYETLTLTTAELVESRERYPRRLIRVPLVAVQGEDKALPIDPYLFGLWLGDGSTNDSSIAYDYAVHDEFMELLEPHVEQWEELVTYRGKGNVAVARPRRTRGICPRGHEYLNDKSNCLPSSGHPGCRKCNSGSHEGRKEPKLLTLRERLRSVGALGSKHIPHDYLTASYEQRMELLRGLVDSDGNINKKGQATFTNADVELFDQVCVLLSSLGFRWYTVKASGTARRVRWQPRPGEPVAKLRHKAERQRQGNRDLSSHRRLRSVRKVSSVPVKCIGIDTEDHLFLAGERMTLTHNTRNTWQPLLEMLRDGPATDIYPGLEPMESFVALPVGRIEQVTTSARSVKGAPSIFAVLDQTEEWVPSIGGPRLAQNIRTNCTKNGGRTLESPNAYLPGENSVAEQSAEFAQAIVEGRSKAKGLLWDHREAPPETDMSDRDSLIAGLRVSYGDSSGHEGGCVIHDPPCAPGHMDLEAVVQQIWDPATDPQVAQSDFLNQITHASDQYISQVEWAKIADEELELADGDLIVAGFDGSRGRAKGKPDATALVAIRLSDRAIFPLGVWEAPDNPHLWPEWQPPMTLIEATVADMFKRFDVSGFYCDPAKDWRSHVNAWEARWGASVQVRGSRDHPFEWWMSGGRTGLVQIAVEQFYGAVVNNDVTHDNSAALTRHVLNTRRRVRSGKLSVAKRHDYSPHKIDALVAAVLAYQACLDAVAAGAQKKEVAMYRPRRIG